MEFWVTFLKKLLLLDFQSICNEKRMKHFIIIHTLVSGLAVSPGKYYWKYEDVIKCFAYKIFGAIVFQQRELTKKLKFSLWNFKFRHSE
jgi:hypothetical protein